MAQALSTKARNDRAKKYVEDWLLAVQREPLSEEEVKLNIAELKILKNLIPIKAKGFRGVVLTAIIGKLLDPTYMPLEDFYTCNPRSIFEQGIYYALQEAAVPCGKSDPLNVAKNIQKLNYDWASGRRPETAARAAVDYLGLLEKAWENDERRHQLLRLFFGKLKEFSESVKSLNVPLTGLEDELALETTNKLANFVLECPEGGAIPQFIVGNIIILLRSNNDRYSTIGGVDESVFGTNTTSKKPADVWEVLSDENYGELYEITVKKIDQKRLDDCVDSIQALGISNRRITFICNLPNDIASLTHVENVIRHRGVGFQFIDIKFFIINAFCLLDDGAQAEMMQKTQAFVFDTNRSIQTKEYWAKKIASA